MVDTDVLQKFLWAGSGPFREHPLKMKELETEEMHMTTLLKGYHFLS